MEKGAYPHSNDAFFIARSCHQHDNHNSAGATQAAAALDRWVQTRKDRSKRVSSKERGGTHTHKPNSNSQRAAAGSGWRARSRRARSPCSPVRVTGTVKSGQREVRHSSDRDPTQAQVNTDTRRPDTATARIRRTSESERGSHVNSNRSQRQRGSCTSELDCIAERKLSLDRCSSSVSTTTEEREVGAAKRELFKRGKHENPAQDAMRTCHCFAISCKDSGILSCTTHRESGRPFS